MTEAELMKVLSKFKNTDTVGIRMTPGPGFSVYLEMRCTVCATQTERKLIDSEEDLKTFFVDIAMNHDHDIKPAQA